MVTAEASADCQAQASAQGSANISCTPPKLDIGFEFAAGVNADAKASFGAKMAVLQAKGVAIVQGFTKYSALIDGKVNGEVVFKPSPLAQITTSLTGVIEAGAEGSLFADIAPGRIGCVLPEMSASVGILGDIGAKAKANLTTQGSFVTSMTSGFKG